MYPRTLIFFKKIELISLHTRIYILSVQNMNKNDQEELDILRKLNDKNSTSQREIAEDMGISLGKLNYCLKALKKKD